MLFVATSGGHKCNTRDRPKSEHVNMLP